MLEVTGAVRITRHVSSAAISRPRLPIVALRQESVDKKSSTIRVRKFERDLEQIAKYL